MKLYLLILINIICASCSLTSNKEQRQDIQLNSYSYYSFKDISGEYIVKREVSYKKNEIAVRQILFSPGAEHKPLEKSVSVSRFGVIGKRGQSSIALRPVISQYSIWFEQKEFFSQFKLNFQTKGFDVYMKSPEDKWNGKHFISIPRATKFCWFSQLPECLKKILTLKNKRKKATSFYLVWDNYPYYGEQYQNTSGKAYSLASVSFDGEFENTDRYLVNVENQSIFYHFNSRLEFEKMVWIAQGITMIKDEYKGKF